MKLNDTSTTLQQLKDLAQNVTDERDWNQFHSPKNLAMYLSIEAGELMEKFVWSTTEQSYDDVDKKRQEVEYEAADVMILLMLFCNVAKIDISEAVRVKLEETKAKYPIEKAKGNPAKYTEL